MKVTNDGFKDRQLHIEGYLQMVSAEQKEYAEEYAHQKITENNDIITDFQMNKLMEKILQTGNLNSAAITQVLTPIYEKQFSENSFGFRPKRSAHDALKQCQQNVNDGYVYVVDMDLEKFF